MYAIIIVFFIIGIIFRTRYKLLQRKNQFIVNKIVWENKDIFSLYLEPKQDFKFKSGQFCFLRIDRDNLYARHPFTISSTPNDNLIRFTIKIYGNFTQEASKLKKGDSIFLEGPFGGFIVNDNSKDLVFFAGGIGITPFISIIQNLIFKKSNQKIALFYCCKCKNDLIFEKNFNSCKNLKNIFILSKENIKGYEFGHINKDLILRNIPNYKNRIYYICGPETLKNETIRILKELKIKNENIKYESFFW
jgi:predicted ferric reductase